MRFSRTRGWDAFYEGSCECSRVDEKGSMVGSSRYNPFPPTLRPLPPAACSVRLLPSPPAPGPPPTLQMVPGPNTACACLQPPTPPPTERRLSDLKSRSCSTVFTVSPVATSYTNSPLRVPHGEKFTSRVCPEGAQRVEERGRLWPRAPGHAPRRRRGRLPVRVHVADANRAVHALRHQSRRTRRSAGNDTRAVDGNARVRAFEMDERSPSSPTRGAAIGVLRRGARRERSTRERIHPCVR